MNLSAMPRYRAPAMAQPLPTREVFQIRRKGPDQDSVRALLNSLDECLGALNELRHSHILGVNELLSPQAFHLVARQVGYRPRAGFGGYPYNGLSLCFEKRLGR